MVPAPAPCPPRGRSRRTDGMGRALACAFSAGRFSQPQQYFPLTPNQPASQPANQQCFPLTPNQPAIQPASQPNKAIISTLGLAPGTIPRRRPGGRRREQQERGVRAQDARERELYLWLISSLLARWFLYKISLQTLKPNKPRHFLESRNRKRTQDGARPDFSHERCTSFSSRPNRP